jgi:hypothetical protein
LKDLFCGSGTVGASAVTAHIGTRFREADRDRRSQASARAGDERILAIQPESV